MFNDKDEENSRSLEKAINDIPGLETLKYKPRVENEEVGEEIVKMFEKMNLVPTLFFVDPWGYKGLSLRLVNSVLKDWGCDCIFFFNYNRINMGLSNPMVKEHMDALLGVERANALRPRLNGLSPPESELMIIEELCQSIKSYGSRYTLPFTFKDARGRRTSHHLIFVSKNFRGYEIMKDIMARESSSQTQGVPSFEYNPADFLPKQSLLFQLSRPLHDLKGMLPKEFAGQTLAMREIYEQHNVDTPYIKKNYKSVLWSLMKKGKSQPATTDKARLVILLWLLSPSYEGKKMGVKSSIEWTESTWNPVTGCTKISEGCSHCYAERMARRLKAMGQMNYVNGFKVTLHPHVLDLPLTWKKPQIIFVNSMSDLFHKDIPLSFIRKVFEIMEQAHWHTFQILTKRAERLSDLASLLNWPDNVWMGVTVENVSCVNRIDYLRDVRAAVRFLSLEPLLGPLLNMDLSCIDWVIVGGESGPGARLMDEKWVLDIHQQCRNADVPFFFKQWGGVNKKKTGRLLNGSIYSEMPEKDGFPFTAYG